MIMTREVMEHIYRIPVPLPNNPLRELNCYLIRGRERSLLIDTGFRQEACRQALFAGLQELGVRMEDTDVLLTHLHSDHTGLLPEVASPESRVYIDDLDRDWIVGRTRFELERQEDDRFAMTGIPADMLKVVSDTHPGRRFAPDPDFDRYTHLSTGDTLEVGGYRLQAIQTPGHTPSHLCLWMEEQQTMFTGDHVLFDITPNITRWPNLEKRPGPLPGEPEEGAGLSGKDRPARPPGHRRFPRPHRRPAGPPRVPAGRVPQGGAGGARPAALRHRRADDLAHPGQELG